jgi:L-2-hydroxyglutarate oxidase
MSRLSEEYFDCIVVGGGLVGTATAYKLSLKFPKRTIALVDKEPELSRHQSGKNSGVIHSGIYYKPGSLKARNCLEGRKQLVEFAETYGIDHEICGKLILATKKEELPLLSDIYERGIQNRTPGIRYLSEKEIEDYEPFAKGLRAIWVPGAGIIDYPATAKKMADLMLNANSGNRLFLESEVDKIGRSDSQVVMRFRDRQTGGAKVMKASQVIVCAGLQSDRIARIDGLELEMQIVGFRGDYYELSQEARHKVKHLIYPVPDPRYPFLGVHFTPMVGGEVECGPNAVFTFKREGYSRTSFDLRDSLQALSFPGTWRLFARNWVKGLEEYRRAFSKRLFLHELQAMIPSLEARDILATRSGVRAQAVGLSGEMIDDFVIRSNKGVIHVINAPSPAATACLAIADEILDQVD